MSFCINKKAPNRLGMGLLTFSVTPAGFQILSYLFKPSIETQTAAQFLSFLFYPQVKINFACSQKQKTRHIHAGFFACDPGRILTCNRWSRNPVRYTVAPRSQMYDAKISLEFVKTRKNNINRSFFQWHSLQRTLFWI